MMECNRRKFISTPMGVRFRERYGSSYAQMKQMMCGHRLAHSQSLLKRDLRGHFGCVNAIEFSSDGAFIASGGDDRRLLLWNIGQTIFDDKAPVIIDTLHLSNINSCCFDANNRKVASGGNDGQVIVHDFNVRQTTAVYGLSDAVYCLSPDPINATIIATASDDGKAQILDTRMPTDTTPFVLADLSSAMHSIMYNPVDPRLLATANSKYGVGLWDIRMPLKSINYKSSIQNCMSVRFNSRGDRLLALRRRSSPVLYDIGKMHPLYEFDYKTYYNACTLKSCSFAGLQDEYVMSGSDDFCIYLWKIPTDISESYTQSEPHMILKGHRSIVNQVRYCHNNQFIISSGVEKLIKLWSPYYIPGCTGRLVHRRRYGDDDEVERNAYSHEEYIHMVLQAGGFLSHDYTNGSTEEEPCMIAFFDSLIQREIEQSVEGEDEEEHEEVSSDDSDSVSNSHDGDDGGGGGGGAGGGGGKGSLTRCASDAPLLLRSDSASIGSSTTLAPANDGEDANNTRDTIGSASSRLEDSSRPFYLDLGSSSDSESEVDEILSAMYSRYMSSRERAMNTNTRPSGKKISSVIAKGKQKDNSQKKKGCPRKLQRIREDLQHSGDQFLRDNATNMSILSDVIDNFVDNLVASESNVSRTLSDTNDGHMSTDSSSNNARENNTTPEEVVQQTITLQADSSPPPSATNLPPGQPTLQPSSQPQSQSVSHSTQTIPVSLDSGMYFMPELQAFAPESFNTVVSVDNNSTSAQENNGQTTSGSVEPTAAHSNQNGSASAANETNSDTGTVPTKNGVENGEGMGEMNNTSTNGAIPHSDGDTTTSNNTLDIANLKNGPNMSNPFHAPPLSRTTSDGNGIGKLLIDKKGSVFKRAQLPPADNDGFLSKPMPPLKRTVSRSSQSSSSSLSSSSSSSSSSGSSSNSSSKYFGSASSSPADTDNGESLTAQFKKAKVKGRRFRVRRSDSKSSSEDEER